MFESSRHDNTSLKETDYHNILNYRYCNTGVAKTQLVYLGNLCKCTDLNTWNSSVTYSTAINIVIVSYCPFLVVDMHEMHSLRKRNVPVLRFRNTMIWHVPDEIEKWGFRYN